jgi:hypothetical protein
MSTLVSGEEDDDAGMAPGTPRRRLDLPLGFELELLAEAPPPVEAEPPAEAPVLLEVRGAEPFALLCPAPAVLAAEPLAKPLDPRERELPAADPGCLPASGIAPWPPRRTAEAPPWRWCL